MTCTCGEAWTGHPNPHALTCALSVGDTASEDVRAIAVALGLGGHARPYSTHEVVQREILPALNGLPLPECPTHAVCPNCREGNGHWNGERYEPTEQSRTANRWGTAPPCDAA